MIFGAERYAMVPAMVVSGDGGEVIQIPEINPVDRNRMVNTPLFWNLCIMCIRSQMLMFSKVGSLPQIYPPYMRDDGKTVMHNSRFAFAYDNPRQAANNLPEWLPGGEFHVVENGCQKQTYQSNCCDGDG